MDPIRIGIIGGGPGGLMTAYLLQRRAQLPCEITLFEASERLGGKVQTLRFDHTPLSYEAGAAELYDYSDTGPDPLREMVQEFGLTTSPMAGRACAFGDLLLKDEHALLEHFGQVTFDAVREFTRRAKALITPAEYYDSDWKQDNADPLARGSCAFSCARISELGGDCVRSRMHTPSSLGCQRSCTRSAR